tara:strand:+ start:1185 stop:1337 length:153 start_codon:yes stop_codon:yes gene_type:complete
MADIKTMTQEVTDLNLDVQESMLEGDYSKIAIILEKIVEKLDEIVTKVNE